MNLRASMPVIAAALLWTSAGWAGDLAPSGWPPLVLAEARLLIGGGALIAWMGPRAVWLALRDLPGRLLARAVLAMAGFQWGFFEAVSGAGSGTAILLVTAVSPFAADALDRDAGRQRRGAAWRMAAVLLCVAAVNIAHGGFAQALAVLAATGSGIAYAIYARTMAWLHQAASSRSGSLVTTAIALMAAGLLLAPLALQADWPSPNAQSMFVLIYLGLIATALAYGLFAQGLRVLSPSQALSLLAVQPVLALAFDLATRPNGAAGGDLGAALLVIGALFVRSTALRFPLGYRRHAGTAQRDGSFHQCH
jgi:DME family drug/metabolite transporter